MNDVIRSIISNQGIDEIIHEVVDNIYDNGPVSQSDMEILSYLALYCPEKIAPILDDILYFMGVFFKEISQYTTKGLLFQQYREYLAEKHDAFFTPIQSSISRNIDRHVCFSFSAPTSTGKSFVFIQQILSAHNDAVVVVPSRALINEYYLKLTTQIADKSINVLTFIDKINTKHARRKYPSDKLPAE